MSFSEEAQAIVIDNGSGLLKGGLSGNDTPTVSFPTIIGRPKHPGMMVGMDKKDSYVGEEAKSKSTVLNVTSPIKQGLINNWEDMEKIWHHCFFNELRVAPEELPILLTEAPLSSKNSKEKMAQICLENFNAPGVFVGVGGLFALLASGRTTGIVLDSGYGSTFSIPVYEGFCLSHATLKSSLAGRDLTHYMESLLEDIKISGGYNKSLSEIDVIKEIKEKHCYLAEDYEIELKKYAEGGGLQYEKEIDLPDGEKLKLGNQRFKCPEALFQPLKLGVDQPGIHELCYQSLIKCDIDIRKDLYANIILSGGSTMFKDIDKRLSKEIVSLAPSSLKIKVIAPPERKYSIWMGGSILSSLNSFQSMWVTKAEYDEYGSMAIHKKCF